MHLKRAALCLTLLVSAATVTANNFRAADTVYLPTAGRVSNFNTDIYISNPNNERVAVSVAFAPSETADNSAVISQAVTLAVLQPGERREILDPMRNIFARPEGGLGQMIFFGCREGAPSCDCASNPGDCRNITVESRIYATQTAPNCAGGAATCTSGQLFAGLPWYSYAARNSPTGFDRVFIAGIRNFGSRNAPASGYRANVGLVNASQFSSTRLTVTLFDASNSQIGSTGVDLGPLGHTQRTLTSLFPAATNLQNAGYLIVEQTTVTPTAAAAGAGCTDGCPSYFAYGSVLDNVTDDPTTLEGQFFSGLTDTQLGCIFSAKPPTRPVRRR